MRRIRKWITVSSGSLLNFTEEDAVVVKVSQLEVEKVIFLGDAVLSSWHHFVIECLPKAYFVQRPPRRFDYLSIIGGE